MQSGFCGETCLDLAPGRSYQIQANGVVIATLPASSQVTLSFATPAGAQSITSS